MSLVCLISSIAHKASCRVCICTRRASSYLHLCRQSCASRLNSVSSALPLVCTSGVSAPLLICSSNMSSDARGSAEGPVLSSADRAVCLVYSSASTTPRLVSIWQSSMFRLFHGQHFGQSSVFYLHLYTERLIVICTSATRAPPPVCTFADSALFLMFSSDIRSREYST